jgi:hypothetical protein
MIVLNSLAAELGCDTSHFRRYAKRHGVTPHKRRTAESGNQLALYITDVEADFLRERRKEDGFTASEMLVDSEVGFFYVIRLVPELDERRIKLGFADNVQVRLAQHRTSAPTAVVVASWPCKRSWERTVMDCLAAKNCTLILNEVFECTNVAELIEQGNRFFALLPSPADKVDLAECSPINT